MKNAIWIAAIVVLVGVAGTAVFERVTGGGASAEGEISQLSAGHLQAKIDAVKKAKDIDSERRLEQVEVSGTELESYVMFFLRDDIPVQMDSIDVQLTPGAVAADAQLTFNPRGTGNAVVDALLAGTHNLFVKGRLSGENREGKFDLEEIRVDGIPVPKTLVETLVNKYVKPKYPEVDLKAPFELPWRIDRITIEQGKATIVY